MKLALISDIHGNAVALEAVLASMQGEDITQFICLGDVASDGPQPCEVIRHLRSLGCVSIMGNMDAWCLDPRPLGGKSENAKRGQAVRSWGAEQLSVDDRAYLDSFQPTLALPLDTDIGLFCYHGSPGSSEEGIYPTTSDHDLEGLLTGLQAQVLVGGHTHTQMLRRLGPRTIINPGSVGAPSNAQGEVGKAEFGILDIGDDYIKFEFRSVDVDLDLVRDVLRICGMPYADWWIKNRYVV